MFDTLVESTKQKQGRTGGFFLATMLVYAAVLLVVGVVTVFWFNPTLSDSDSLTAMLAPPPPPPPPPPPAEAPKQVIKEQVIQTFTPPKTPPKDIPKPTDVKERPKIVQAAVGGVAGGTGSPLGIAGGTGKEDEPPPPPPPPKPSPSATPTPPPPPKKVNISGGVLQGNAIRRVQPPYPPIAKAARAAGAVQVAVEINEDGDVTSASAVGGHPLLREAAVQAARQWKFKPTLLSGVPVKVSGVLTFNFTLQ
ncbi:MAG TPA: TonB family protein [Blastocatellia bacterium]|nr:TonB family protein [Blastocatellia bacterium]